MATTLPFPHRLTARQWTAAASPLVITLIGIIIARLCAAWLGIWAWVGVALVYWGSLALTIRLLGEPGAIQRWMQPSQGKRWLWLLVALIIGITPFPMLLIPNAQLLRSVPMTAAWFIFAVINANVEEAYWRGFLLDGLVRLPRPLVVIATNLIFTALHPLMWGAFSRPMLNPGFWVINFVLGLLLSAIYLGTRSLRLPVLAHFLADLGNLSIFVFMNLVSVPGL